VRRGRITKQGSKLVRWAVIEAVSRYHGAPPSRRLPPHRGAASTRPGWRWPARCSRSSPTAYATATSVASPRPGGGVRQLGHRQARARDRQDSRTHSGEVGQLLEPTWSWPERTMPSSEGMPRQPSRCQLSVGEDHRALNPPPTPELASGPERPDCAVPRRRQGLAPPGWPPASLAPAPGQRASPHRNHQGLQAPSAHNPRRTPLTRPHSFRDAVGR
jgi:hypothetical protein